MGAVDIGGSGTVHLVGGCAALMSALLLGPRIGRFEPSLRRIPMGNGTNALLGMFMLWWGWLGFSAGSTFGITGEKWKYSSRASVTTILATMGAGTVGLVSSWIFRKGLQDISFLLDSILASLVAISGGAPIFRPFPSIAVGSIAACLVLVSIPVINKLQIDDPTNSFAVHAIGGFWGMIAIGLFVERDDNFDYTHSLEGLFINGESKLLISQLIACAILTVWSVFVSFVLLLFIKLTVGLRVSPEDELLGADFTDHGLIHNGNEEIVLLVRQTLNLSHLKWSQTGPQSFSNHL
ncbi:putative ammonium transporter 3-like protein [Leptotrombidium deliense]|uniref:Putative ammonium transporter 3-like protein n=1 Tax=Leptotrombidium deliense TaxID=299467 RepID=A0A443SEJ3_9ACAR|nr:putative ammonium transporter 3-like protein [Leptotrombidium deliense]